MLPDIVLGYKPGSSFSLSEAAEHICLYLLEVMRAEEKKSTPRQCAIVQQKIHINVIHRSS